MRHKMNWRRAIAFFSAAALAVAMVPALAFAGVTDTGSGGYNKVKVNKSYESTIKVTGEIFMPDGTSKTYFDQETYNVDFESPEGKMIVQAHKDKLEAFFSENGVTGNISETDQVHYTSSNIIDTSNGQPLVVGDVDDLVYAYVASGNVSTILPVTKYELLSISGTAKKTGTGEDAVIEPTPGDIEDGDDEGIEDGEDKEDNGDDGDVETGDGDNDGSDIGDGKTDITDIGDSDPDFKDPIASGVTSVDPIIVKLTRGDGSVWVKGSSEGLVLASDQPMDMFAGVSVNGVLINNPELYVVSEGSTIVTLKPAYLETLEPGSYDVSINSWREKDNPAAGFVEAHGTFVVKATASDDEQAAVSKSPKTGDGGMTILASCAAMALLAAAGAFALLRRRTE